MGTLQVQDGQLLASRESLRFDNLTTRQRPNPDSLYDPLAGQLHGGHEGSTCSGFPPTRRQGQGFRREQGSAGRPDQGRKGERDQDVCRYAFIPLLLSLFYELR